MSDYEKMGSFYLGRKHDLAADKTLDQLTLYDSKDLTTHAVCVGMTGSGKTGLCLSLIEEAGLDGVPVLAIDPKGDLGNLLLMFPDRNKFEVSPRKSDIAVDQVHLVWLPWSVDASGTPVCEY